MSAHRFVELGAWGSKRTTIAARRCAKCGFTYIAMNVVEDPPGKIRAMVGEDGKDVDASEVSDGCTVKG